MRNIIITGAAGGLGSAIVNLLKEKSKYKLYCIDSNINSQLLQFMSENKQQIDTIKHSLTAINDNVSKMNS